MKTYLLFIVLFCGIIVIAKDEKIEKAFNITFEREINYIEYSKPDATGYCKSKMPGTFRNFKDIYVKGEKDKKITVIKAVADFKTIDDAKNEFIILDKALKDKYKKRLETTMAIGVINNYAIDDIRIQLKRSGRRIEMIYRKIYPKIKIHYPENSNSIDNSQL